MRANDGLESRLDKVPDAVDRGAIEVPSIFPMFDEFSRGNIGFHLVAGVKKVVFAVNLPWPTLA